MKTLPFLPGHRTGRSLTEKPCKLRLQGFVRYLMNTVALFGIALSKHKSNIRMQVEETPLPCVVLSREANVGARLLRLGLDRLFGLRRYSGNQGFPHHSGCSGLSKGCFSSDHWSLFQC